LREHLFTTRPQGGAIKKERYKYRSLPTATSATVQSAIYNFSQ
jgi:hypothetical protein